MSLFASMELGEDIVEATDKIGGGYAKFNDTGYYEVEIEKAYAGTSNGGAFSVTVHFKREDGAKLQMTEYISSGTSKGCKNYYLDKNGVKQYLPGYNKIKSLDAILGYDRQYPLTSTGKVMLWDRDLKTEIPVEKEVIKEWVGKKVGILVMKKLEDKYANPTEFRTLFEVEHFVLPKTGQTRNEIVAGSFGFKDKWLEKFDSSFVKDERDLSKNSTGETTIVANNDESPL